MNTADNIPIVDPMMVREFTPAGSLDLFGGSVVMDQYEVEDVGMATSRLPFDAEIIDCSHRVFDITTQMIVTGCVTGLTVFPSRRWRNLREGNEIQALPSKEQPLLFIGNPIRLLVERDGLVVVRERTYVIKSGVQMGY